SSLAHRRLHMRQKPRAPMSVFSAGPGAVDSWTPSLKPLCHRHRSGPHPSGLPWTPWTLPLLLASLFRRKLAADQRRVEVAPGVGHLLDLGAGHAIGAAADLRPAQSLVEEARRVVGQHPQDGGVAAVGL